MIKVTAGFMPGKLNEYTVEAGATAGDVLAIAGLVEIAREGLELRVNSSLADSNTPVPDGAYVILSRKAI